MALAKALAPREVTKADRQKATNALLRQYSRGTVAEEWKKVDDKKLAKLRGILAALQDENQSTQLLKKESENAEARRELESTRSGVECRLLACLERQEKFEQAQQELRRHVLESEKSLQEIEATIEKGEKKSRDEQAECRKLDAELAALEADLAEQEVLKENEKKKIAKTLHYKKFLDAVVNDYWEDFQGDIENLMNRHKTLEAGNAELHQTGGALTEQLDSKREEAQRVKSRLQSEHLVIGSQLHESQVTLDRQRGESREMEQRVNRVFEEKEVKESQVGVIQMAIEQLFSRTVTSCCFKPRRKAMTKEVDNIKFTPVREQSDVRRKAMLKQIVARIQDLEDMNKKAMEALQQDIADQPKEVVQDGENMLDKVKIVQASD
jgi:chromosome segregation ATPase